MALFGRKIKFPGSRGESHNGSSRAEVVPLAAPATPAARDVRPPGAGVDLDATLPVYGMQTRVPPREVLEMRCLTCQGTIHRSTAPVRVDQEAVQVSWDAVPAWVCTRCGRAYFEREEVETVLKAIRSMRELPAPGILRS
jgi:YgiT-type zinc finger domain-containing protein